MRFVSLDAALRCSGRPVYHLSRKWQSSVETNFVSASPALHSDAARGEGRAAGPGWPGAEGECGKRNSSLLIT